MGKRVITALLAAFIFVSGQAQEKKVFETKVTAVPTIAYGTNDEMIVYAGGKNVNIVHLPDGKLVTDKTYKEAGVAVSKASDAGLSNSLEKLVICDEKNVSCIDTKSFSKAWEISNFNELGFNSLMVCDNYVLVSDKKGKDNFSLTCLSLNDGKEVWSMAGEKVKLGPDNLYFITSTNSVGIFNAYKGGKNTFRIVDLASGKIDANVDIEGIPVYSLSDEKSGNIYLHNRVSESSSYVTAVSMKDHKMIWKTKSANKSPQTPQTMNTDVFTYYAKIKTFDNKVLLVTEGIEAFDAATGKSLYNIPFVPYYKWGVGQYTNGIFEPVITPYGILLADRTSGDMFIKMMDKETGKQIWSSDKLKGMENAPNAIITGNSAAIQFGGLNYFEVISTSGIGKLLNPFKVLSFDLQTGKLNWTVESKKDFYYIAPSNDDIMIVGKDFQLISTKTGTTLRNDRNPFKEDFFMTKYTLASTHKYQRNAQFDFSQRVVMLYEDNKLSVYSF